MSLNVKLLSFGDLIKFTVDGQAVTLEAGAGVSGPGVKPDGTTPADWKEFTRVEKGVITSVFSDDPVFAPSPGVFRRVDIFRTMTSIDLKITGIDCNEIILQSVFQTAALTTVETPVAGKLGQVRGWLQLTRSSQNDATVLLAELYGIISVKDLTSDGKRFKPEIDFSVLHNALNTLTPSLAAA